MGENEAKILENMEDLYEYVRSWGMEEDYDISFTYWKGVVEYREPVDTT